MEDINRIININPYLFENYEALPLLRYFRDQCSQSRTCSPRSPLFQDATPTICSSSRKFLQKRILKKYVDHKWVTYSPLPRAALQEHRRIVTIGIVILQGERLFLLQQKNKRPYAPLSQTKTKKYLAFNKLRLITQAAKNLLQGYFRTYQYQIYQVFLKYKS